MVTIADTFAASLATQGILAALYEREHSGVGQLVQANLFQACLYAQAYRMVTSAEEIEISAQGDVAPYGAFEAADGWFTRRSRPTATSFASAGHSGGSTWPRTSASRATRRGSRMRRR